MNVFVLCTGRCGSMTFARACGHATNYTADHESRRDVIGPERLDYPPDHIEVDNRLSWMLGRLEKRYGDDAFYVHLTRDAQAIAESYAKRTGYGYRHGMTRAYAEAFVFQRLDDEELDLVEVCYDMNHTVEANIRAFLADKTNTMHIDIADVDELFPVFWERIGAEGDLAAAMAEFQVRHNEHVEKVPPSPPPSPFPRRLAGKVKRIVTRLPEFVRDA